MKKTHWRAKDKTDYLGAADLDEMGGKIIATIKEVKLLEITLKEGKEFHRVAYFVGNLKPMVVNVTNGKVLKKFTKSKYLEDWKNIAVTIYVKNLRAFGEDTEGLRFEAKQPNTKLPELTPEHDGWEGALKAIMEESVTIDQIRRKYTLSKDNEEKLCGLK